MKVEAEITPWSLITHYSLHVAPGAYNTVGVLHNHRLYACIDIVNKCSEIITNMFQTYLYNYNITLYVHDYI